jgi:hypothetical protein
VTPPIAVDIDGTLTRPEGGLDPRVFEPLREWPAPVVLATGKAFPYPVALCQFVGIEEQVVAENGGVAYADDHVEFAGDPDRVGAAFEAYREAGGLVGWGGADTVNRWRETEFAVSLDADRELLGAVADEFDLEVVDTGYAYHVKETTHDKATGLRAVASVLDFAPESFVAVGDSENDVATFRAVERSFAVGNADDAARAAADVVVEAEHGEGFLAVLDRLV